MSIRPSLDDIRAAARRLEGVVVRTPLAPLHSYGEPSGIYLKPETLQPIGSFKLRTVFNAVAAKSDEERARGLSTTSAGNTAQALAWTARHFGTTARSLMPETAPETKVRAMEAYGGTPVLVPGAEVFRFMTEEGWRDEPYTFIHPWREMAGSATIGLEIVEDMPDVERVYVPVGGGGLIGGVGSAIKSLRPEIKVIGVEPEGCCALTRSLEAGEPVSVQCQTICDGVAVPLVLPDVFEVLREVVDETVLISDRAAKAAVKRLALRNKLVAEPAGGLAVAAALAADSAERGRCVAIVSGGSINADLLAEILTDPTLD
ncbi:MAG TPA: pyridoxal-phosphate dependent enzyme [Thermomicrobiales bacterium]|nr:pyridoxal-phosphate dependent enzyme [Thermomicrobiales bacterium]